MRTLVGVMAVIAAASCSRPDSPSETAASGQSAVFGPSDGKLVIVCDLPELSITIKVDSASTGLSHFAMGTAELTGANAGVHDDFDELIFVYGGGGMVFVEGDTLPAEVGTTMYVRRGDRHGFTSDADAPLRFAWVIVPQALPRTFLEEGVSSLDECE